MKLTKRGSDSELAIAEKAGSYVQLHVEEFCRIKRREDINLDYLKRIVVKFLSLSTGSSEKASLLPVLASLLPGLATFLQDDDDDYKTTDQGKIRSIGSGGRLFQRVFMHHLS